MSLKRRILVTGGREFNNYKFVSNTLTELKVWFENDFVLIHGAARGIDQHAHCWAFFTGCPVIEMKANWDFYGKPAGAIRNGWMLKYANPDLVVAFPGGKGTANMIEQARKAGIDVYEVIYAG